MKNIFHLFGNGISIMMVLVLYCLGISSIYAQTRGSESYISFVEEGKVWYCGYNHPGVTTPPTPESPFGKVIDCIFTMSGDTEIDGKTYKKVYCQFKEYYGDEEQHYYCAVREEDYRVYIVEEEATEEQLIYDFSHWGENVTLTYNDLKYGRDGGKRREIYWRRSGFKLWSRRLGRRSRRCHRKSICL